MALLCLLLMAAFYLAVIIGQPQEDETASTVTPRTDQPLLSAGQDVVTITSADDLPLLLRMFPAPALAPTTSGWSLVVGTCYDEDLKKDAPKAVFLLPEVTLIYCK